MSRSLLLLLIMALANVAFSQMAYDTTGRKYAIIFGKDMEAVPFRVAEMELGHARHYRSGDAADAQERIHYYLAKEGIFLTFAEGEVDFMVEMSYAKPSEKYTVNTHYRLSGTDFGGIRLGMSKAEFFKGLPPNGVLDKSEQRARGWYSEGGAPDTMITFLNHIPLTKTELKAYGVKKGDSPDAFYTIEGISIDPEFSHGKLVKISVDKTTTY